MKRIVYAFFALIFLIFSVIIPDFSSFATVVIPDDDSTHYYLYNHIDFDTFTSDELLTNENYNLYYDALSGNDKTDFNLNFTDNNGNRNALLNALVDTSLLNDTSAIYFYPITYQGNIIPYEECKHILFFNNIGFATLMYYSPTHSDIVNVGNYFISDEPFIISYQAYSYNVSGDNVNVFYYTREVNINSAYDSTNDFYYNYTLAVNFYGVFYSDIPCLFTSYNSNYTNYDTPQKVYALYKQNDNLAIDRRTPEFINKISGDNSEDDLLNDVDLMQFEGDLGFEYFDFKGYITENQGLIFPNYIVNYKLNNYTDLRKENIEIYASYSFDFKLTFQMAGNQMYGYQSANMGTMGFMDMLPVNQNTYGMDLNAYMDDNTFVNYRETAGLHLQSNGIRDYENIQNFNQNSMIADFGRYFYQIMNNVSANKVVNSKRDSYFYITCEFWIEYIDENGRRTQSNKIIRKIDYWGDSSDPSSNLTPVVNDIDSSGIIDDDQAYHDFIDSYNYKKINEDTDGYLNYLPSTSNNSNQSSVGDITIYQNPYPYVLVDIPENQWLNNTPNLKTILTDFKTMLAETKEGSILNFFPEVYNYFPAPVWSYLIYGIGICIMIGIWRGITRR